MFSIIKSWFLKIFGDIKVFKWPMFVVYDPVLYQISGASRRKILNVIQPGDIVLHGYVHYLDGYFIPGKYSHSGVYVGDNTVIHAVAEGVCTQDILDFMDADCCAIVRLKDPETEVSKLRIQEAIRHASANIGKKYDFFFTEGDDALYCHEHSASCYPSCDIKKHIATALWGLIKKKEPVYLAQSFIESPDFEVILEV